ncbi:putative phage abortive infection protein [Acinetobacter pittii]|uniref:putative phage abortive infection protein n=1 Tax=Acinetobacter pittii TaxID=48296 RepID=UPI002FEEDA11
MSEKENTDKDLEKIDQDINSHRELVIFLIIVVILAYLAIAANQLPISESLEKWGTFGDFFGGILNPIFGLFAFYWLTYSVRLQIKELKETREELKKAAEAQSISAQHQASIALLEAENVETQSKIFELNKQTLESQRIAAHAQAEQIAIQNFESLFFQLLKTKTDVTNDILVGSKHTLERLCIFKDESNKGNNYFKDNEQEKIAIKKINQMIEDKVQGKESIKDHIIIFKSHVKVSWEAFYTESFLDYAGSYFRVSYQIVKLIDENQTLKNLIKVKQKEYSKKQKEYFDIFRATFTQYELEAFFFNCLSKYGNKNFKKLLEKYGMFEPLLIDTDRSNERLNSLTRYAYMYDLSIFEKSDSWKEYFINIENLKENFDSERIRKDFYFLWHMKIIINPTGDNLGFGDVVDRLVIKYGLNNDFFKSYFVWGMFVNSSNIELKIKNSIKSLTEKIERLREELIEINGLIEHKNDEIQNFEKYFNKKSDVENQISKCEENIEKFKDIKDIDKIRKIIDYGIRLSEFIDFFNLDEQKI